VTNPTTNRQLRELADAAGAVSFAVVRETKHLIVDFSFPGEPAPVRLTMSKSCSDKARGFKNQIGDLRRAHRVQQSGA
jgi:hypothetical protein